MRSGMKCGKCAAYVSPIQSKCHVCKTTAWLFKRA